MNNDELTITISGRAMSGKTTLAEFILRQLVLAGLSVNVDLSEREDIIKTHNFDERFKKLKNKTITVQTLQTNREGKYNHDNIQNCN